MENDDFEDGYRPCADVCPYLRSGDVEAQRAIAAQAFGSLCVASTTIEHALRVEQTKRCAGADVDTESGAVYCNFRDQGYAPDGTPGVRNVDEMRMTKLLKVHHASVWKASLERANATAKRIITKRINALETGEYSDEDVAFARSIMSVRYMKDIPLGPPSVQRAHDALNNQSIMEISEAVKAHDAFTEYVASGLSRDEALNEVIDSQPYLRDVYARNHFTISLGPVRTAWF